MREWWKLGVAVIGCQLVGILATPFTIEAIPTWYAGLTKPFFSPPNWVFGPVWTILYFLMGVSVYLVWREKGRKVGAALRVFCLQLLLNFIWSILFFGLRSPLLGLINIAVLWVAIMVTIIRFNQISKLAGWLLIPYLLWVSFASILNLAIVILN